MNQQGEQQSKFRKAEYTTEAKFCSDFLNNFEDPRLPYDTAHGRKKYLIALVGALLTLATSDQQHRQSGQDIH